MFFCWVLSRVLSSQDIRLFLYVPPPPSTYALLGATCGSLACSFCCGVFNETFDASSSFFRRCALFGRTLGASIRDNSFDYKEKKLTSEGMKKTGSINELETRPHIIYELCYRLKRGCSASLQTHMWSGDYGSLRGKVRRSPRIAPPDTNSIVAAVRFSSSSCRFYLGLPNNGRILNNDDRVCVVWREFA